MSVTLEQVEDTIANALGAAGINVSAGEIQIKEDVSTAPYAYIKINDAKFVRETNDAFRQTITVSVIVIFRHVKSVKELRRGIYPVLTGTIGLLTLQTLGLPIKPLSPKSFSNVTNDDLLSMGTLVFQLDFETSWLVKRMETEAAVDLLRVGLAYFLKPGDDVVDAADVVTLGGTNVR